MDDVIVAKGYKDSTQVTEWGKRVKPRRKLDLSPVSHHPLDILFRWDSVVIILKDRFGKDFSGYQLKVLLCIDNLCRNYGAVSVSYYQVQQSGCIRGLVKKDIKRSLNIIHGLGMIEPFGVTQGGGYQKYRMTSFGDCVISWIQGEYECPNEILKFKSKSYRDGA